MGLDRLMAGDTAEAAAVAGHLAGCAACTAELARIRRTAAMAREVIAHPAGSRAPRADARVRPGGGVPRRGPRRGRGGRVGSPRSGRRGLSARPAPAVTSPMPGAADDEPAPVCGRLPSRPRSSIAIGAGVVSIGRCIRDDRRSPAVGRDRGPRGDQPREARRDRPAGRERVALAPTPEGADGPGRCCIRPRRRVVAVASDLEPERTARSTAAGSRSTAPAPASGRCTGPATCGPGRGPSTASRTSRRSDLRRVARAGRRQRGGDAGPGRQPLAGRIVRRRAAGPHRRRRAPAHRRLQPRRLRLVLRGLGRRGHQVGRRLGRETLLPEDARSSSATSTSSRRIRVRTAGSTFPWRTSAPSALLAPG